MYSQYKPKQKRERDPSLPPPPNLFSQGKEIREMQAVINDLNAKVVGQNREIAILKDSIRTIEDRLRLIIRNG